MNLEVLESNLLALAESKQDELDRLKSNELQVSRKRTGLVCYTAVVNYLVKETKPFWPFHPLKGPLKIKT